MILYIYFSAYLGVTLHWLHPETFKREMVVLACIRLHESITYSVIAEHLHKLFQKYDVLEKTLTVTTDNGSNFVKAFRFVN